MSGALAEARGAITPRGPDTLAFDVHVDAGGYNVTVKEGTAGMTAPGSIPMIDSTEAHVHCFAVGVPQGVCTGYLALLPVRGRLYGPRQLSSYLERFPFPAFHSGPPAGHDRSFAGEGIFGVIDSASLQRVLDYSAEFSELFQGPNTGVRMQITTGMGQRFFCSKGKCTPGALNQSYDGLSLPLLGQP